MPGVLLLDAGVGPLAPPDGQRHGEHQVIELALAAGGVGIRADGRHPPLERLELAGEQPN